MSFSTFTASSAEGPPVTSLPAQRPDRESPKSTLHGDHATLRPILLTDAPALFFCLGGPSNAHLYKYMPFEPPLTLSTFTSHIEWLMSDALWFAFTILVPSSEPIGIIAFLNIVPIHRTIEVGHVLFSSTFQKTTAATEVHFLLLKYAFEELGYERVEWKANTLNEPSMRAALRLGFVHEGNFRRHMVVKGRRRDSWWGSVIVEEWPEVKAALDKWLSESNFDVAGTQKRKLEEFRNGKDAAPWVA